MQQQCFQTTWFQPMSSRERTTDSLQYAGGRHRRRREQKDSRKRSPMHGCKFAVHLLETMPCSRGCVRGGVGTTPRCCRATSAASSLALLTQVPSYQYRAWCLLPSTSTVLDHAVRPPDLAVSQCLIAGTSLSSNAIGTRPHK